MRTSVDQEHLIARRIGTLLRQLAFNQASVGRRTSVLLERKGKKPGQLIGKTPWLQSVHLETDAAIGDLIDVEIVSAGPNSMAGRAANYVPDMDGDRHSASLSELLAPGLHREDHDMTVAA
jgi:hypothetical protein